MYAECICYWWFHNFTGHNGDVEVTPSGIQKHAGQKRDHLQLNVVTLQENITV